MAFDQGSYTKTQQEYNSALARLQKSGIGALKGANAELKAAHDKLEAELNRSNQAATQRMKRRSAEVAAQLQADAAKSRPRTVPGDHRITKMGEVFKRDAEKYKQALAKMRAANRAFQADMSASGIDVAFNRKGDLDQAAFMGKSFADRETTIEMQKARMAGMDRTTNDYKRQKRILDQIVAAHRNKNILEREESRIISDNERRRRSSFAAMKAGLRENNQLYREQLQMQMQMNSTLRRGIQHLQTGLVNALMASSIALMSFGFKLQGVVSTFQEFEKELMNAQSIFQTTNDILFSLSDEIVKFGTQYGISLGTASEGLYTLA